MSRNTCSKTDAWKTLAWLLLTSSDAPTSMPARKAAGIVPDFSQRIRKPE
jgi:hypothetical protein